MDKLWAKRTPPTPLDWDALDTMDDIGITNTGGIRDQETWTLKQCKDVFSRSVSILKEKLKVSESVSACNTGMVQ